MQIGLVQTKLAWTEITAILGSISTLPMADNGSGDLSHLTWTLIDLLDTSVEKLANVWHIGGPECRCSEWISGYVG